MAEMKRKYCYECGTKLEEKYLDSKIRHVCPKCHAVNYINPIPAAAVVIIRDGKILLVKRGVEPKKGLWSLPAGFIEVDETVQQCAIREVKEETGLDIELTGVLNVYTIFDDPRYVCLLVVYKANIKGGILKPGDDADATEYFPPHALPPIAFAKHSEAIKSAFKNT